MVIISLRLRLAYFNSIKVQLELITTDTTFIFHEFQFHKGAIRTYSFCSSVSNLCNFNSIKVRLEQEQSKEYEELARYFNSIKVRLEPSSSPSSSPPSGFQFHKGAIRTHQLLSANAMKMHFNSIKVRLEQGQSRLQKGHVSFQFHKGAIRTAMAAPSAIAPAYFNSIKVRLEQFWAHIPPTRTNISIP